MRNTSLCYIERDGCYLMLHRIKKKNDANHDKWIGVGGGFFEDESPEDCCRREALEETGLTLTAPKLRAVITFVIDGGENELMFLFTCTEFTGTLRDCDEGTLEWIPKSRIFDLELWEGDRIFLKRIEEPSAFFTLKLVYDADGGLTEAVLNGTDHLIDRRQKA